MSTEADSGLSAAVTDWRAALHPRGHDGRFIEKFSFVSWVDTSGKHEGQVTDITEDPDGGPPLVRISVSGMPGASVTKRPKELTSIAKHKAVVPEKVGPPAPGFTRMYRTVNVEPGVTQGDILAENGQGQFWSRSLGESSGYGKGHSMTITADFPNSAVEQATQTSPTAYSMPIGVDPKVVSVTEHNKPDDVTTVLAEALRPVAVGNEVEAAALRRRTKKTLDATPEGKLLGQELTRWLPGDTRHLERLLSDPNDPTSQVVTGVLANSPDAPELHRGVWEKGITPDEVLSSYTPGQTLDLPLMSFSANMKTAEMFGGHGIPGAGTPLIITVEEGGHGIPIQNLAGGFSEKNPQGSFWRNQEEYLSTGQYEVVSTRKFSFLSPTNPTDAWKFDAVEVRVREKSLPQIAPPAPKTKQLPLWTPPKPPTPHEQLGTAWGKLVPHLKPQQKAALGRFDALGDQWMSQAQKGSVDPELATVDKLASRTRLPARMNVYRGLASTASLDAMSPGTDVAFGKNTVLRTYLDQGTALTSPAGMKPGMAFHPVGRDELATLKQGDTIWVDGEPTSYVNSIVYSPSLTVVETPLGKYRAEEVSVGVEQPVPAHGVLEFRTNVGVPWAKEGTIFIGSDVHYTYRGFEDRGDTRYYQIDATSHTQDYGNKIPHKTWDGKIDPIPKNSSLETWTTNGKYQSERQKLTDKIIGGMLADVTPVEHPKWIYVAGGPAAGKDSMIDQGLFDLPDNAVFVDPDRVKEQMPEYQKGVANGDKSAASKVHEESSWIAREGRAEALDKNMNIIANGVGDSNYDRVRQRVAMARRKGYEVDANYVTISTEEALARNEARFKATGRKVPETTVKNAHKNIPRVIVQSIQDGLFDNLDLWDNNATPSNPVKIAEMHGETFSVLDQERWDAFVAQGEFPTPPDLTVHPILGVLTLNLTPEQLADIQPGDHFLLRSTGEQVRIVGLPVEVGGHWRVEVSMSDGTRDYVGQDDLGTPIDPTLLAIV